MSSAAAIDTCRFDADIEAPVEPAVLALDGPVAALLVDDHGAILTAGAAGHERESDIPVACVVRRPRPLDA